ncbi:MAG: hypothetical protein FJX25_15495 [Alphaproteobacteria bacterium]|nr:hypothetical protein [Alphaproteobacteria bacterium]
MNRIKAQPATDPADRLQAGTLYRIYREEGLTVCKRGGRKRMTGAHAHGDSAGSEPTTIAGLRLGLNRSGEPLTGERTTNDGESDVIRWVFREFADGRSPKAIAQRLHKEGIPGPRGQLWRDTAIRGHRIRGTGLLNNQFYIGRLVWNRLRYVKDPAIGRRVSRLNPPEALIITGVSEMRIIDQELWERVKARQDQIDQEPRVTAIKATRFWEKKRRIHLLTGLSRCGTCGGSFAAAGQGYLACSAARKLGTCTQRKSIRRSLLEEAVLQPLKDWLMQSEAVAQFIKAVGEETNARSGNASAAMRDGRQSAP